MPTAKSKVDAWRSSPPSKDVDDFLSKIPGKTRLVLAKLRKDIKAAAPMAEEKIGYGMPMYRLNGHLVAFSIAKNHCSLHSMSPALMKSMKSALEGFDVSGATIHFTPDKPLPAALIKKIVNARIKENISHSRNKKDR